MEDKKSYETKLKKILLKFSGPNFTLSNNYNTEKLLTFLSQSSSQETQIICYEWIKNILSDKNYFLNSVSNSMKTFIFRLTSLLSSDDMFLQKMLFRGVIDFIFDYMSNEGCNNHSLKHAFINILVAMCKQINTMQWLLEKKCWRYALKTYNENNTVYLTKVAAEFIVKFLWELNDRDDEQNCVIVLEEIIQPLCEHPWKDMQVISSDQHSEMDRLLSPVLALLVDIIGIPRYFNKKSIIETYLNGGTSINWYMVNLAFICKNENVIRNMLKVSFISIFSKVNMYKKDEDFTDDDIIKCHLHCVNMIHVLVVKQQVDIILDFCMFSHRYLKSICDYLPPESGNKNKLEALKNHFILMPVLTILATIKNVKNNDKDILNLFHNKLFVLANEQGTREAYKFFDLVKEKGYCETEAIKSIHNLMSAKESVTVYEANIIFQALFYKLKDFVPTTCNLELNSIDSLESPQSERLLCTTLDALHWIIEKYDISWQESVEVICVYQITTNLISMRNLGINVNIKALRLIKLTIEKFLPPNIALLIDSPKESNMNEIGKIIYTRLHDINWEVRDSTIEVLLACTKMALIKYPPLQNQIVDHGLGSLTVMVALNDSESYVRISALRCLGVMANIQKIWDQCLAAYPKLLVDLLKLLYDETEGMIRKEAVTVLSVLYEHMNMPDHLNDNLFQSMCHSVMVDLYWEVQLAALNFWKIFLNCMLTNEGMIDGKFPSVTFSKESRKIVTLTDTEVVKRLKKVLKELSTKGCLGALLYCLTSDDVDVEIMEFSYNIVKDIKLLLDEYKVECDFGSSIENDIVHVDSVEANCGAKRESDRSEYSQIDGEKSNTVIESILNADDISLLANVYRNQLTVNQELEDNDPSRLNLPVENLQKSIIDPEAFIKKINSTDYSKLIDAKKSWISGNTNVHSLFDDILGEYHCTDVNDMDCY